MPDQFKLLDPVRDVVSDTSPSLNSLISITSATQATTYDTTIYTIGPFSGSTVNKPDSLGTSTAGISASGAINTTAMLFFGRHSSAYYNSASGVYTLPASHTANVNVSVARVIQVARPNLDHGIWPDSLTCVFTYNSTSITAVDSSRDSFGPNKQDLSYGKLTDITNFDHVLGSIFYDSGIVLLHGGTGSVASSTVSASVTGFAFRGSITGALSASTSASHIIVESLSYRTYKMKTTNTYFCRVQNDEFNFTSNPSAQYVDFLQNELNATTYITTIGLYDDRDNLCAVAKVSPPMRKNRLKEHLFQITLSL